MIRHSNNGIIFFDDRSKISVRVSLQQIAILKVLEIKSSAIVHMQLHYGLWGKRAPLTGSERASLSRTLSRLKSVGFITIADRMIEITEEGKDFIKDYVIEFEDQRKRYEEVYGNKKPAHC